MGLFARGSSPEQLWEHEAKYRLVWLLSVPVAPTSPVGIPLQCCRQQSHHHAFYIKTKIKTFMLLFCELVQVCTGAGMGRVLGSAQALWGRGSLPPLRRSVSSLMYLMVYFSVWILVSGWPRWL